MRTRRPLVVPLAAPLVLATLAACTAAPAPIPDPLRVVAPDRPPALWDHWADVRAFVGDEAWDARGFDWLERRAWDDLAHAEADFTFVGPLIVAGVHRLGRASDGWWAVLEAHEPEQPEAGGLLDERLPVNWRARFMRFAATQRDAANPALARALQRAVDEGDLARLAACLELGRGEVPGFVPTNFSGWDEHGWSEQHARELAHQALEWHGRARVERYAFDPALDLLEAYGAPDGFELEPLLAIARARREEVEGGTIPLPHPYDTQLAVLRFERLVDGAR